MDSSDILTLIEKDPWMMEILRTVEVLDLRDWWIGAGFVRGKVWDHLHGYKKRTPLPDIDIIYFDPKAVPIEDEVRIWKIVKNKYPDLKWSVTNTAFRHIRTGSLPYKNSSDCLSHWVETATCVGVSLKDGNLSLTAPLGTLDLTSLILRPTDDYRNGKEMKKRIKEKLWLRKWPKLKVILRK